MNQRFTIGQSRRTKLNVDASTIAGFAEFSGDKNPIHLDPEEARAYGYPRQLAHGALLLSLLSKVVGMDLPGPGAVLMSQSTEWLRPVFEGDEVELVATVGGVSTGAGIISLDVYANNQKGEQVMKGNAKVKLAERMTKKNLPSANGGHVALITGASRGIGAEIARRLGHSGFAVAANYLSSRDSAEGLAQEIQASGGSCETFAGDLSDPDITSDVVREVIRSFGRVDVVVHGASPSIDPQKVDQLRYGDLEPFLKVYVGGALSLLAGASPGMVDRKFGRFIFMGTSAMFGPPPMGMTAYMAAKEALWGLVKGMATELGPSGITTNMVSPGITATDLTAFMPARTKEVVARTSPMRRLATSQDTAELVAFLASDAAGYINGVNMPVIGGPS